MIAGCSRRGSGVARAQSVTSATAESYVPRTERIRAPVKRRKLLTLPFGLVGTQLLRDPLPARAFTPPPPGFRFVRDQLDGYAFLVKDDWLPVTSAGNEVAFRSPRRPDQNLFVNISSPSTSRFQSIKDVGTVEEAGKGILGQYLKEFMSTRIGVVRQGEYLSGTERPASDGRTYYDIEVLLRSYASRSQLAVTQEERQRSVELEWERKLLTVVGVANKRRYDFRLQANADAASSDWDTLRFMADSFRCYDVTD